ncbi:diaminopimelate decarboxylase [Cocleimonas flava]|uniref:Diaminopimelate decarboxylase n=1 Tax=Cocleimonas flava TaxID=634765 RepID=A0A4V2P9C4_9GAMM|nr:MULTISPECIES: diaminopimelate decarboxylase [Cocleimonas]MEB8431392.1 diaminopimelate decarboxylase [Cocleimonas sp. KMM 6892]MEC4713836.1 diaminopimelate decarboxylase [Cocleimonas sp. KMM 6895]MEC4743167.1 diaminopimelate decarboxylase [Cocleimonas sp. KMM 6896]TCJ89075.1 diaminopimelate decarboxylase [Cocleimonas flava]
MDFFNYKNGQLFAEDVALDDIAKQYGTPCYVYSRATLERHYHAFNDAFGEQPHLICYSVKANSNIAILNLLARLGSGFDIVSVGELERVLKAGGDPKKIVFSGVGKRADEMQRALEVGIRCFNVESEGELVRLNDVAASMDKIASISIRVNPDVDAKTHPYISTGLKENKFGIDISLVEAVYLRAAAMENINVTGIDCHIGSQLTDVTPFMDALERLLDLADRLKAQGIDIKHLDLGGGLGVRYKDETPPLPSEYTEKLFTNEKLKEYEIVIEPGRAIAANTAVLLTKVEYLKHGEEKNFAIVDAAMNDLIRPSLYQAWQAIIPVNEDSSAETRTYDIVGPICETGDFLGKDRDLALEQEDLLAIRSAGAYGFTMASNYNTRPRAAEVLVDGEQSTVIRKRETIESLFENEIMLPKE